LPPLQQKCKQRKPRKLFHASSKSLKVQKITPPIEMHFIFLYYTIMKEMDGYFSAGIMGIIMDFIFERSELNSQMLNTNSLKIERG
jgi:hypothetical protein